MTLEGDRLDRGLFGSVLLHGALFAAVFFSPKFFPMLGPAWGNPTGGSGGISVKVVASVSGVALPTPAVVHEEAPANESPGFYKSEEPAPPPPDKTAEPIPETKAPVKTTPTPKPKPKPPAPPAAKSNATPEPPPTNAIPYGQGGRPSMTYGQFQTGAGEAGIGFGDAAFGDRYSTYVNAITRAISNNWLKSMVDSRIQKAPRVYVTFDIERDGTISNFGVQQSSGIPSLDRSAERAVRASNPLPQLPADYRGGKVNVVFYFEYSR
jgi:periplasmic protein TonB